MAVWGIVGNIKKNRLENYTSIFIVSGWWLSPTPLKNHGVRQVGI
jgi:hypothetical protein